MNNRIKFVKANTSFVGQTGYNAHSRDFFTALSKKIDLRVRNFTVGKSWNGLTKTNSGKYLDPHKDEYYLSEYQRNLICEQTLFCDEGKEGRYGVGLCDYEINDGLDYMNKYNSDEIVDIILSETFHHYYYDFNKYKGFKIAYNVWESTLYDRTFFKTMNLYDQIWCPTNWQRNCIINQGADGNKVFVVPEAVDGSVFYPEPFNLNLDLYKDNRFKFILVGRWEYRKSTTEIINTFLKTFTKDDPVDLILIVDNDYSDDGMKTTEERLKHYNFNDDRLKVQHFLKRQDYINLLKNGHVFLSCSRSEGWNLPLIEAMACGIPSIYSNWGGQLEFAKDKGHPVNVLYEKEIPNPGDNYIGKVGNYIEPDFEHLSEVMHDVYTNYWRYKNIAIAESEIIRNEFSWDNAANKAMDIINNIKEKTLI